MTLPLGDVPFRRLLGSLPSGKRTGSHYRAYLLVLIGVLYVLAGVALLLLDLVSLVVGAAVPIDQVGLAASGVILGVSIVALVCCVQAPVTAAHLVVGSMTVWGILETWRAPAISGSASLGFLLLNTIILAILLLDGPGRIGVPVFVVCIYGAALGLEWRATGAVLEDSRRIVQAFVSFFGMAIVVGTAVAITVQDLREQVIARRRQADFAGGILDTAQVIIVVLDHEANIVRINRFLEELSGWKAKEVQGQNWFKVFLPAENHALIGEVFDQALAGTSTRGNVNPIRTREGELRFIEWYDTRIEVNHKPGLLAVGHDITERRVIEQEQEFLRVRQAQFIQNVSHELRTPLALVRGYAEMLGADDPEDQLGPLTAVQAQAARVILLRSRELSALVEDIMTILELDQADQGLVALELQAIDLSTLVVHIAEQFRPLVEDKGLELHVRVASDLVVWGDEKYIQSAVTNVLSNAVKFTDAGQVQIVVSELDHLVALEVQDTGIGISADKMPRIFERFYQANGSATRRYGGTGLGLAVVKEVMRILGGRVRLDSEEGAGTTVSLYFPKPGENEPENSA